MKLFNLVLILMLLLSGIGLGFSENITGPTITRYLSNSEILKITSENSKEYKSYRITIDAGKVTLTPYTLNNCDNLGIACFNGKDAKKDADLAYNLGLTKSDLIKTINNFYSGKLIDTNKITILSNSGKFVKSNTIIEFVKQTSKSNIDVTKYAVDSTTGEITLNNKKVSDLTAADRKSIYDSQTDAKIKKLELYKENEKDLAVAKAYSDGRFKTQDDILNFVAENPTADINLLNKIQQENEHNCDGSSLCELWYFKGAEKAMRENLNDIADKTYEQNKNIKAIGGSNIDEYNKVLQDNLKITYTGSFSNDLKNKKEIGSACKTDIYSSECQTVINKANCNGDTSCQQSLSTIKSAQSVYDNNKAVQVNAFGNVLGFLQSVDSRDKVVAKSLFNKDGENEIDLPDFLDETFASNICKSKIEGYLDKDIVGKNQAGIGGITKYSDNSGRIDIDSDGKSRRELSNIEVVYDLRSSHTGLTPDNKINIHYSYYLNIGSSAQFMVSVNYINSKGNLIKVSLFEEPKDLTSKIQSTGFYDLNVSNGIQINTLKLKLRAKTGGADIITPIEIPILPASADAYTGFGNDVGNAAAKNAGSSTSTSTPIPESWD